MGIFSKKKISIKVEKDAEKKLRELKGEELIIETVRFKIKKLREKFGELLDQKCSHILKKIDRLIDSDARVDKFLAEKEVERIEKELNVEFQFAK